MNCLLLVLPLVFGQVVQIQKVVASASAVVLFEGGVYDPGLEDGLSYINVTLTVNLTSMPIRAKCYGLVLNTDEAELLMTFNNISGFNELSCQSFRLPPILQRLSVIEPDTNKLVGVCLTQFRQVKKTSYFKVVMVNCKNVGLELTGQVIAYNPYGLVPGSQSGFLIFYPCLCIVYLILTISWGLSIWWYQYSSVFVQKYCMSYILVLCLLEAIISAADWSQYNETGQRSQILMISSLISDSLNNTAVRILLLIVAMGWGLLSQKLNESIKVMSLGLLYFLSHLTYSLAIHNSEKLNVSTILRLMAALPVVSLNAMIVVWTWICFDRLQIQLAEKKQFAKLRMVRKLKAIVVVTACFGFLWGVIESYYFYLENPGQYWQDAWLIEAFWIFQIFLLLLVLLWIWRPNSRSVLLGESEELSANEIELTE